MRARVYAFIHQTDTKGEDGFTRLAKWVSEQEERVQISFSELLDGATRDKLIEKMVTLASEMKDSGMDPVAEATAAVAKDSVVEEMIVNP